MNDIVRSWKDLPEPEWLSRWQEAADGLDEVHRNLLDSDSGMTLTDLEVAHLQGEIVMLRRVLDSKNR